MLISEYEMLTGTKVYPDVYQDIIEPMYNNTNNGIDKITFCQLIDKEKLSEIPAVPYKIYVYKKTKKIMIRQLDPALKWLEIVPVGTRFFDDKSFTKWVAYSEIRTLRDNGDLMPL